MRCETKSKTIVWLRMEQNRIDLSPPYQRESGVWGKDKKQLFIDSIINGFDVPKFYFHDLTRLKESYQYAVIDGKQRLTTLFEFMDGKFPLADDFEFRQDANDLPGGGEPPQPKQFFGEMTEAQKEYFKSIGLDIVAVEAAIDEIEDLFSRLNNGEPLNAAEKRNARGGAMVQLIREVAEHTFFKEYLAFPNRRGAHLEVAAKFILLELAQKDGKAFTDLKKKHLDAMVEERRAMKLDDKAALKARVFEELKRLEGVFEKGDELLSKQSYPQLYYGWVRQIESRYAVPGGRKRIHTFLEDFTADRIANNEKPEDDRDPLLVEFGMLTMQGTNDLSSMEARANTLTRYFLESVPDAVLKDTKRAFTEAERYVIWILGKKTCALCAVPLPMLKDMQADHLAAWAKGGATTLQNAQCLCGTCNAKKGKA